MDVAWTLRLYPKRWRDRYGEEMAVVLEQHHATVKTAFDLLLGAVDARLHAKTCAPVAVSRPAPPEPAPRVEAAAAPLPRMPAPALLTTSELRPEERQQRLAHYLDAAIAQAERSGAFADLPGKGKPIPAEQLQPTDERWLPNKLLASGGFLPRWLQLQQEIDADLAECLRLVERVERYPPRVNKALPLAELRGMATSIRKKAFSYNLIVPSPLLQRPAPDTDALLHRMERALG